MAEQTDDILGLEFSIDGSIESALSNGEDAFIINLKIDNKSTKSRKITLLKATYITSKREQLDQDIWLSGYITGDDTLKPNSFKKAGLIFYKSKLKSISENDEINVSLILTEEGQQIDICFMRISNNWLIIGKEKNDIEIKLSSKQLEKKLLKCIERLEAFEERLGMSTQNISISINDLRDSLTVLFELHSNSGTTINEWLKVECVLYDKDGLVIGKKDRMIDPSKFFGFEVIDLQFYGISEQVSKIRVYPKKN